jgi:hypothetical protein
MVIHHRSGWQNENVAGLIAGGEFGIRDSPGEVYSRRVAKGLRSRRDNKPKRTSELSKAITVISVANNKIDDVRDVLQYGRQSLDDHVVTFVTFL